MATSGRYSSVRFVVDERDNLPKIRINNIDTVAKCLHLDGKKRKSPANYLVNQAMEFYTVDEISGEKIHIDVEVRGKMGKEPRSGNIEYTSETYLLLTHPALVPGANPHLLKKGNRTRSKARYTCTFADDVKPSRYENLTKSTEVHPSVRVRMENV